MKKLLFLGLAIFAFVMPMEAQYPVSPKAVFVPQQFAKIMEKHLSTITARSWAEVVPGDLEHGHLIMKSGLTLQEPVSLETLFHNSAGILYHSDEQLRRWRLDDGRLPNEQKRPRSIVGWWDGRITAANFLIADPENRTQHYRWHGSIHADDLAEERKDQFAKRRDWLVLASDGRTCSVNLIIDIYYGTVQRPNITVGHRKYHLTFDCK